MRASSISPAGGRRRPGGPRRWTAADKTHHLAAFAARGGTIAAYCATAGVPNATFTLWQREQRRSRPTFARVEVTPRVAAEPLTLHLRRAGMEADVTGLDAATLLTVLGALLRADA